jgi:hypothetical protein
VTVFDGLEFPDKRHSSELFPHMQKFKKIKQEQDKIKETPAYNAALREMAKLYLNSFTGKLLEQPHCDEI